MIRRNGAGKVNWFSRMVLVLPFVMTGAAGAAVEKGGPLAEPFVARKEAMQNSNHYPAYTVQHAKQTPKGRVCPDDPAWQGVPKARIEHFQDRSSDHRPVSEVQLQYDDLYLYVRFYTEDRYVRAVAETYQDMVCLDSCVEFFVQPKLGGPYFNFEVNAGGVLLLYCIPVAEDGSARMNQAQPVPFALAKEIKIHHSLPAKIDPEIQEPVVWLIEYAIPLSLLEYYCGPLRPLGGEQWRANFYKCADATSHPHWGMWSPIREGNGFHRPQDFGKLIFDP